MAKKLEFSALIDLYGPVLTEKQREVVEQYYYEDLSLAEIAENCGITRQGVRDAIKRSEAIIYDLEDRLQFSLQYKKTQNAYEIIKKNAQDILIENNKYSFSQPIQTAAEAILKAVEQTEQD